MAPGLVLCVLFVSVTNLVMSQDMNQCMMKLQLCQMSLQSSSSSSQVNIDPCSTPAPMDACSMSSKVADCLRANLSSCMSIPQVKEAANTVFASRDMSCSPEQVCPQKLSLCSCHMKKAQPPSGDVNSKSMELICAAYSDFEACVAENKQCADIPQFKEGLAASVGTYGSMCSKGKSKICMEGMGCMQEVMTAAKGSMSGSEMPSASVLCRSTQKMFDCLGAIKNPDCGAEESDVTFEDIKNNFLEICNDGLSRADSLTQCKEYNMCIMKNNPGLVNASDPMKLFADIGRTSFWCTYLVHSLSCASSMADTCSLSRDLKGKLAMHEEHMRETCDMETKTESGSQMKDNTASQGVSSMLSSMLTTLMAIAVLLWLRV